jgi:hypothetical protein
VTRRGPGPPTVRDSIVCRFILTYTPAGYLPAGRSDACWVATAAALCLR